MGDYDFTYQIPANFDRRIVQFLQQVGTVNIAQAFLRCSYEWEVIDYAFYAGFKTGDNWNKKAVDFTIEGTTKDIALLNNEKIKLKDAIGKALKPTESGFLVRDIYCIDNDTSFETVRIPPSDEERLNADIAIAQKVLEDLIKIGERICLKASINADTKENDINDSFRDMLIIVGYDEVKYQTRHGISTSGKDAGEVDILLTKEGKEIAIFEGLNLKYVRTAYIDEHIEKAIINYNALGTATFIVAYVSSPDFEVFWERYSNHIRRYEFPLQIKKEFHILPHPNASIRVATMILSRNSYDFPVYFMALKIC